MRNVEMQVKGATLTITIDLSKEGEVSASGKSLVIASTHGNAAIADNKGSQFKVGLNVYKPAK